MARKTAAVKGTTGAPKAEPKAAAGKVASTTPVRNSAIPKVATAAVAAVPAGIAKREVTQEMIAVRAYEIAMGGTGGSEQDNWFRAERELRAGA